MQDYNQPNSRSFSLPKNPPQEPVDTTDEKLVSASQGELLPKLASCNEKFDSIPLEQPSNIFAPIDGGEPSLFQTTTNSVHSGSACTADERMHHLSSENSTSKYQTQGSKRKVTADEESRDTKRPRRQLPLPATPSSSPFQTLRVTKARRVGNNVSVFKTAEDTANEYDDCHSQVDGFLLPHRPATMNMLTPFPTRRWQEFGDQRTSHPAADLANMSKGIDSPMLLVSGSSDGGRTDLRDEYPLDDGLIEEDMMCLLDTTMGVVQETHMPPSSVTQAWDHDSRSAGEYDPTLQHSSPVSSTEKPKSSQSMSVAQELHGGEEDLLDEDVDWNAVYAITNTIPKYSSAAGTQALVHSPPLVQCTYVKKSIESDHRAEKTIPMKPFVRPPFPEKIRDRATVSGLSSDTVLRTCFRIGEMINQAAHCLCHRQDVVFELFARVNYSNRESLQRRQHFQFIDLFKDQRPYPAGVLTNWRLGGQLDRQSSAFLNVSAEPRLCRCVCKPIRDSKTTIGLSLVVLSIRESDWTQIEWVKQVVCGGPDTCDLGLMP
ncbi:hypothetical protein F4805DRAFT_292345 [Annulohypoxylon moriforme]|nr:hypothetical protein F4805DRAFT_292345 [Annulohypoxylon moriforme]